MAMGGSSPQPTTTTSTTTQELAPEQRELLALVMPKAKEFINTPIKQFPGSTIAGFDPMQIAGQNMTINAATNLIPGQINNAQAANSFLLGPVLYPESNPALAAATNAAIRPIVDNFQQSILPSVRAQAVQAGGYGGTRQGIAEGLAANEVTKKVGDVSAAMANQNYQAGLGAMTQALQMQPQLAQLSLLPGTVLDAVGSSRRNLEQALLSEQANKYMTEQLLPWMQAQDVAKLAFGIPGGSTTTTGTAVQPGTPDNSGMQALMAGLSIAAMFAMSEREYKRDVEYIGEKRGIRWYSFRYLGEDAKRIGVMADELARVLPKAIMYTPFGRMVNYGRVFAHYSV